MEDTKDVRAAKQQIVAALVEIIADIDVVKDGDFSAQLPNFIDRFNSQLEAANVLGVTSGLLPIGPMNPGQKGPAGVTGWEQFTLGEVRRRTNQLRVVLTGILGKNLL